MYGDKKLYPLSEAQKRIWYTQMIYPDSSMFHIGGTVSVFGMLDVPRFQRALQTFIHSEEAFRIRFISLNGDIWQYFEEELSEQVPYYDFSARPDGEMAWHELCEKRTIQPFSLTGGPLHDFFVYKIKDKSYGFYVKMHHVIADGWAMQILSREIVRLYEQDADKQTPNYLPAYRDYAERCTAYLESEKYRVARKFWMEYLQDAPFHTACPGEGIEGRRELLYIEEEQTTEIKGFCKEHRISLNSFFLFLYLLWSYKVEQRDDIIIGIPVLGRIGKRERETFGMFVSSIPFRFRMGCGQFLLESLRVADTLLRKVYRFQQYPYNHMVKDLELRTKGMDSLYRVCINYYDTELCTDMAGMKLVNTEFYNRQQEYALQIIVREWNDRAKLELDYDYKITCYTDAEIRDLHRQLMLLARRIIQTPSMAVSDICLLSESQWKTWVDEFNNTRKDYDTQTVLELFKEQAGRTPDWTAAECEGVNITYAQLYRKARVLNDYLQEIGVHQGDVIGILASHSLGTIMGILGIWMAGGAYLPIDPQYPPERIEYILEDAGVSLLLFSGDLPQFSFSGELLDISRYDKNKTDSNFSRKSEASDAAYVIYTSGSTGNPKGVAVGHASLSNYIRWAAKTYVTHPAEVFPLYTSLAFDLTVTSLFVPLISGGIVLIYSDNRDEYIFSRIVRDNRCTVMKLTPSHLELLRYCDCREWRVEKLIVGGESLSVNISRYVWEITGGRVRIFNEYGPTEATVGCMIHEYCPDKDCETTVPIGKPIDNARIYVLDRDRVPLLPGREGELYIAGDCLALGYHRHPELDTERFCPDTVAGQGRMYKTGDRARFAEDGLLTYLGRNDDQIQRKGFRIEPLEIERRLQEHPAVERAVIVYTDREGTQRLTGYCILLEPVGEDILLSYLRGRLPAYMLPDELIYIDHIPLTSNGKVDAGVLERIERDVCPQASGREKPNEITEQLIHLAGKLLDYSHMDPEDNFFHLGGDSIKAIQLSSRLRDAGLSLRVRDILSYPVLRDMAAYISKIDGSENREYAAGDIPATPIFTWFAGRMEKRDNEYCQSLQIQITPDRIDWNAIVHTLTLRHTSMRINWNPDGRRFFYNDYPGELDEIVQYNLRHLLPGEREDEIERIHRQLLSSMDCRHGYLIRSCVFHLGNCDVWEIMFHHLTVDGVSWRILLDDINTLLNQVRSGQELRLTSEEKSYGEYARLLRQVMREKEDIKDFRLSMGDIMPAPHARKPIRQQLCEALEAGVDTHMLSKANLAFHTNTEDLLVSAFIRAYYTCMGIENPVLLLERTGRSGEDVGLEVTETVGWFTSLLPVRLRNNGEIGELVEQTKEIIRLSARNSLSFGKHLDEDWVKAIEPQWIRFNYLGEFHPTYPCFRLYNEENLRYLLFEAPIVCGIEVDILHLDDHLRIYVRFDEAQHDSDGVQRLLRQFCSQIREILRYCGERGTSRFTPSDFSAADLSAEDLRALFL